MAILQKEAPRLSILILNYHTDKLVTDLLKKLGNSEDVEIIVVDNNESDSLRKKFINYSYVKYYQTEKNLGFSGGNNYGLKKTQGEWVFILNSDTLTSIDDIKKLIKITEKRNYLAATPKLIYSDGQTQNNVAYFNSFFRHPINWLLARPRFLNCSKINKETQTDFANAAALLLHRSVFQKIGLFDNKNFFMYFEDLDFSLRLHQRNIPILYVPDISIIHLGGGSSNQDLTQKNIYYNTSLKNYLRKHRTIAIEMFNNIFHLFR